MRIHQEEDVFASWGGAHVVRELLRILDGLPVDFLNHIAGLKTGIVSRAARTNAGDRGSVNTGRQVKLLAGIGVQVVNGETKLAALMSAFVIVASHLLFTLVFADFDGESFGLAVAEDAELDFRSGSDLADCYLELASILDLRAVEFAQNIAALQAAVACR